MVDNTLRKVHMHLTENGGMLIKGKNEFGIEISIDVSAEAAKLSRLGKKGFFFKEDRGTSYFVPYKQIKMNPKNPSIPIRVLADNFPIDADALHLIYELVAERYMGYINLSESSYIQGLEEKYKEVLEEVDFWEVAMVIPQC